MHFQAHIVILLLLCIVVTNICLPLDGHLCLPMDGHSCLPMDGHPRQPMDGHPCLPMDGHICLPNTCGGLAYPNPYKDGQP